METWKPLPGFIGTHEVSDKGRIRSLPRTIERAYPPGPMALKGKILKPYPDKGGHLYVNLYKGGVLRRTYLHHAVMLAFVGPRPEGLLVCHNNGIPNDNRLENLRYDTSSGNQQDRVKHGNHHHANKTHCKHGHPFDEENTRWRWRKNKWAWSLSRECITCQKAAKRRAYWERKLAKEKA